VAILDEWHQTFLPSRTGSLRDVALDTMGAMVMQAVVLIVTLTRVGRSQGETE
jgi:VanZ family protein